MPDTTAVTARSALTAFHDPYFTQFVPVSDELVGIPRTTVFRSLLEGKRVLHVGYADWPITDPTSNLHVSLDPVCAQLDGIDPNDAAAEILAPLVRGRFFRDWDQVTDSYDVVLIPEVLEHVGDIAGFLADVDRVRFSTAIITVPDAFQCMTRHFDYDRENKVVVEVVHPDHNAWFTPYTFSNVIRKYTDWQVEGLWFFNGISLLMVASKS